MVPVLAALASRAVPAQASAGPEVSRGALFRIEWNLPTGVAAWSAPLAPHGFVVSLDSQSAPLAVTAHHVFEREGSQGGDEVGRQVRAPRLRRAVDSTTLVLGEFLPIPDARTIGRGIWHRDMAAFRLGPVDSSAVLVMADSGPAEGDTVWLFANVRSDQTWIHPARVTVARDTVLVYVYLEDLVADLTSGAAVLDRAGRVVGWHECRHHQVRDRRVVSIGSGLSRLLPHRVGW